MAAADGLFANVVAVRFSLRISDTWARRAYGPEENRGAWFAHRARIMRLGLLACLRRQTVAPVATLILMDEGDRPHWRASLADQPGLTPLFSRNADWQADMAAAIGALGLADLVISRIDSDDLIAEDYLAETNRAVAPARAAGEARRWISACAGYVTNLRRIQSCYFDHSPFLSLYLRGFAGETVYAFQHTEVLDHDPVLADRARWMQILHGSNLANQFNQPLRVPHGRLEYGPIRMIGEDWPAGFPRLRRTDLGLPPLAGARAPFAPGGAE